MGRTRPPKLGVVVRALVLAAMSLYSVLLPALAEAQDYSVEFTHPTACNGPPNQCEQPYQCPDPYLRWKSSPGEFCVRPYGLGWPEWGQTVHGGARIVWVNKTSATHKIERCTRGIPPKPGEVSGKDGNCGGYPQSDDPFSGGNAAPASEVWDPVTVEPNKSGSVVLNHRGTYQYYCTIHGHQRLNGLVRIESDYVPPSSSSGTSGGPAPTASPTATARKSPAASPPPTPAPPLDLPLTTSSPQEQDGSQGHESMTVVQGAPADEERRGTSMPLIIALVALVVVAGSAGFVYGVKKSRG